MSIEVRQPGLLTTVQDLGRVGYQRHGVVVGGALDRFALRVANMVVGNEENAAGIEIAQSGPELRVGRDLLMAWSGADFDARIGYEVFPRDRAVAVRAGETIRFGPTRGGLRAWLAVAGGIDVPLVLGSRSTYRRAGFGGWQGRPLQSGDILPVGDAPAWSQKLLAGGDRASTWSVRPETLVTGPGAGAVRVVTGPEWESFPEEARALFRETTWQVTKDADRMGVRLSGPALSRAKAVEIISSAVNEGVIQVPAGGQPIVLLASRQTIGGYPRLAAVIAVDLGRMTQLRPGDTVKFQIIPLAEAHGLYMARERNLTRVRAGLARLAG